MTARRVLTKQKRQQDYWERERAKIHEEKKRLLLIRDWAKKQQEFKKDQQARKKVKQEWRRTLEDEALGAMAILKESAGEQRAIRTRIKNLSDKELVKLVSKKYKLDPESEHDLLQLTEEFE